MLGIESTVVAKSLADSVLFIMGSLMLAVAVVKQQLDKRIAYAIVRLTGTRTINVCFGISVVSGLLASFIGEHTVAAMMLPVSTLIQLTSEDKRKVRGLAAVLLFSIAYGCSVAGIGTPSGGARNAIMVGYWKEFFFDPTNPGARRFLIDYVSWMAYAYRMFLLQLPLVTMVLLFTFRPEYRGLSRAVVKLRSQVAQQGPMRSSDWVAIIFFGLIVFGWISQSSEYGMGTIAVVGACLFLIAGLIQWEDVNSGVNWGVVLLYAAAISLGVQMKDTGAAQWMAKNFLAFLTPIRSGRWDRPLGGDFHANNRGHQYNVKRCRRRCFRSVRPQGCGRRRQPDYPRLHYRNFLRLCLSDYVVGTPATACIVYASGYLKATDFLKVGWRMAVISTIVMLLAAALYWPLIGV